MKFSEICTGIFFNNIITVLNTKSLNNKNIIFIHLMLRSNQICIWNGKEIDKTFSQ